MSAHRQTVRVLGIVRDANNYLANPDTPRDGRQAIIALVSMILLDSGNYFGFNYLRSEFLSGEMQTDRNVLRDGYDSTRVHFYISPKLR